MEHFLEGIAPLRHWYINPNENRNKYKSSLPSLTYQSLNGALPLKKCSNKASAKCKPSVYVFNEVNDCIHNSIHMYIPAN